MREKIKEVLTSFEKGDLNIHEATKKLDSYYPKPAEVYDKARETPFNVFVKYLREYGKE